MRGRALFDIVEPVLTVLTWLLKLIPHRAVVAVWWLVDWIPGIIGTGLRYAFARRLCASCGRNVAIGRNVEILNWRGLALGTNVSIHRFCYLDALGGISIGDDVSIAHGSSLLSFEHSWDDPSIPIKDNPLAPASITISRDVWIGAGVRVLSGVTIGSRSVVAAGAVVTKPMAGGCVYAGVPAREVRSVSAEQRGSA